MKLQMNCGADKSKRGMFVAFGLSEDAIQEPSEFEQMALADGAEVKLVLGVMRLDQIVLE